MQTEPVASFDPTRFLAGADIQGIVSIVFLVLFIIWSVYTLVAGYHWLRYGHNSALAIPILIVHAVVSWLLAGYAVSGIIG